MNKVSDIDGYKFSQQEISILEASQEEKDEKTENVFSIVSGKKEQDKS